MALNSNPVPVGNFKVLCHVLSIIFAKHARSQTVLHVHSIGTDDKDDQEYVSFIIKAHIRTMFHFYELELIFI